MRAPKILAALALAATLAVVAASAFIRLAAQPGPAVELARAIHRLSASLVAIFALVLAGVALVERRGISGALGALVLVAFLAVLGPLAGRNPPPAAALANLLGGFALAALLAWLLGRARAPLAAGARTRRAAALALAAAALACAFVGWSAIYAAHAGGAPLELARELAAALLLCAMAERQGRLA